MNRTSKILARLIESLELELIKAKAQLEYVRDEELIRLGKEENE
tara:strand:+ start:428 stop:559 length:132 start_codon:yes stop_codon:yes gene_type:complete